MKVTNNFKLKIYRNLKTKEEAVFTSYNFEQLMYTTVFLLPCYIDQL